MGKDAASWALSRAGSASPSSWPSWRRRPPRPTSPTRRASSRSLVAAVALAALASVVSFATEQVGERFGPAVTGVLQSTLGNLPEFFIVLFALGAGQVVVAQTSIVGSLFANALLVLGLGDRGRRARATGSCASAPGCRRTPRRCCSRPRFVIVLVALAVASHDEAARHVDALSAAAAVCLLAIYGAWLWVYLRRTSRARRPADAPPAASRSSLGRAARGGRRRRGVRLGLVRRRARAGDRGARHLPGVRRPGDRRDRRQRRRERGRRSCSPHKGDADLAISVVKNSVAQIAVFLFPALVLVSLFFSHHLTFARAGLRRGDRADRHRAVADHRRRRGDPLRGRRADRHVRHTRRLRVARLGGA